MGIGLVYSRRNLGGYLVNVEWQFFVGENVFKSLPAQGSGRQPLGKILFLNGDDRALVSRRGDLGCRFVRDGRKRIEAGFPWLRPVIPETSDQHVASWL